MSEPNAKKAEGAATAKQAIYVVDDEVMLLELAAVILDPLGYEILTFRDPKAALKAFRSAHPRPVLLITDYAMHQMNGMELVEACRAIEPPQKILMISGTVGPEIYRNSAAKPDRFLSKPYQTKQLIETVRAMLATTS